MSDKRRSKSNLKSNSQRKLVRLNKLIADSGHSSRRQADRLIESGNITVNGKRVFELGIQVDPSHDTIKINGKSLPKKAPPIYLMVNKPKGVLSSTSDPENRPVITDIVKKIPARLFPVGRLDWDSEGLILMTNDGDFSNKITHPKGEITKTYLVKVEGDTSAEKIGRLIRGVTIVGGKVKAKQIERVEKQVKSKYSWLKVIITEGKNRQIRKMFEKINCDVMKLQRVAIGRLKIGSLKKGEFKLLTEQQMKRLFIPDEVTHPIQSEARKTQKKSKRSTRQQAGSKMKKKKVAKKKMRRKKA